MILAAGFGTRLRPLTYKIPKPLLPVKDHKLIDFSLFHLAKFGIKEVVINLHHLGDMVKEYVGSGDRFGVKVTYSEEEKILGTGGGIKKVESLFDNKPFIVMNVDAVLQPDLNKLIETHQRTNASCTMVLKKKSDNDSYGSVDIDNNGFIKGFGKGKYFYTGVQIVGPKLLEVLPSSNKFSCLIKDGYKKLLDQNEKIASFIYDGYFNDVGTQDRYEKLILDFKNKKQWSMVDGQ